MIPPVAIIRTGTSELSTETLSAVVYCRPIYCPAVKSAPPRCRSAEPRRQWRGRRCGCRTRTTRRAPTRRRDCRKSSRAWPALYLFHRSWARKPTEQDGKNGRCDGETDQCNLAVNDAVWKNLQRQRGEQDRGAPADHRRV